MRKGRACNLDFACRRNGRKPAKEFVESLDAKDRVKFEALLRQLSEQGKIWNKQKFKKLRGGSEIWEFIAGHYRLFCFQEGRTWVLTNGFRKESNRTPQSHIDLAVQIRQEHLEAR